MNNKIIKKLISLSVVAFSFIFINNALAYNPYDSSYWLTPVSDNSFEDYADDMGNGYYTTRNYPNDYNRYSTSSGSNTSGTHIVNNYYYQTNPSNTSKTNTTSTVKTVSDNKDVAYNTTNRNVSSSVNSGTGYNNSGYNNSNNNLGASAYNGYSYGYDTNNSNQGSNITALSWRGSGGFMPSSIWQWVVVVILILAIIIISRMIMHRKTVVLQGAHVSHSH